MFRKGHKVKLRKWATNPNFFDSDRYMFGLCQTDKIFTIKSDVGGDSYILEATTEHPRLGRYVWRSRDLIPIGKDNDPNVAFMLHRLKE